MINHPFEDEQNQQLLTYILLSNPVLLITAIDRDELQATNGFVQFSIFKAYDISMTGVDNDVLIITDSNSYIFKMYEKNKIFSFNAYYLPCEINATIEKTLPETAAIFLTAPLEGCSFIAGRKTLTSEIDVAHINIQDEDGNTNAKQMGAELTQFEKNHVDCFAIHKDDYYGALTHPAFIFGLKSNNQWHFNCVISNELNVLKIISTDKSNELSVWQDQQNKRAAVLTIRNQIHKRFINQFKNDNTNTNEIPYQLKISGGKNIQGYLSQNEYEQLKIIHTAQSGKITWSSADSLLKFLQNEHSSLTTFSIMTEQTKKLRQLKHEVKPKLPVKKK